MKYKMLIFLFFGFIQLYAQTSAVTGVVLDEDGVPVPGVTVMLKSSEVGTATDFNGRFTINAQQGEVLVFSSIGFATKEFVVGTETDITVTIVTDTQALDEVVVTALGIKREKKSLGYAQQSIEGEKVVQAKDVDINSALAGKIAGVQLIGAPSSSFDNASIRLRGEVGALYVVDGVKIYSSSDINMEDVADISVLKGIAGTALYGPEAINGAVIITTKSAKNGETKITIDEALSFSSLYLLPEYQNEYGGGYSQEWTVLDGQNIPNYSADESWGPRLDGTLARHWDSWIPNSDTYGELRPWSPNPDNVRDFYETATTNNFTLNMMKGGEDYNIKTTINNLDTELIVPNTGRTQTTVSFKGSYNVTDKLSFTGIFNYQYRKTDNFPNQTYGGLGSNFNQWWQRQLDIDRLKNYRQNGQIYSWNLRSTADPSPLYWNSPYFEVYENVNQQIKHAVYGNIGLNYEYDEHLSALVEVRKTYNNFEYNDRNAWYGLELPSFSEETTRNDFTELYTQVNYDNNFGKFDVIANIGAQWNQRQYSLIRANTTGGLQIPDYYSINTSVGSINYTRDHTDEKTASGFATVSLGYDDFLFLDGSYRKDWSSTANPDDNSVDTYGGSASFIFSELLPDAKFLSFGKLRAGIAQATYFPSVYAIVQTYSIPNAYTNTNGSYLNLSIPNSLANNQLIGGIREEREIGTELKFFQNRLGVDFTYFTRDDNELPSSVQMNGASGYTSTQDNASHYKTKGWEIALTGTPIRTNDFTWNVAFNIARYRKTTVTINDFTNSTQLSSVWSGYLYNDEGDLWGNIYGYKWERDAQGNILLNSAGTPQYSDNIEKLANVQPDFTGGFNSAIVYKNFDLNFSLDFQKGGSFYSVTKMFNASSGLSPETVGNNDLGNPIRDNVINAGGSVVTSVNTINAAANSGGILVSGADASTGEEVSYYVNPRNYFGNLYGVAEQWLYDASYIKLRQISLGYTFPKTMMEKLPIDTMKLSVYANNLWLIYSEVDGIDPSEIEDYYSYDSARWVEAGQSPSQRVIGLDLKLSF